RTALMPFHKRAGIWRPNGVTGVGARSDELRPLSVRRPSGTIPVPALASRERLDRRVSPGDDGGGMPGVRAPRDNDWSGVECSHEIAGRATCPLPIDPMLAASLRKRC